MPVEGFGQFLSGLLNEYVIRLVPLLVSETNRYARNLNPGLLLIDVHVHGTFYPFYIRSIAHENVSLCLLMYYTV